MEGGKGQNWGCWVFGIRNLGGKQKHKKRGTQESRRGGGGEFNKKN